MPIGGSNIGWSNSEPSDVESAGLGDDRIRSMKSSIQGALDNEHNFASGGGANTGYHRFGACRPYYGAQSLVSSSGSDARLMQTSDTSRLFHVGSAGTSFIGGATVLSAGSYPGTTPQRHYWAFESATGTTDAVGVEVVTFPRSGFSNVPFVFINAKITKIGSNAVNITSTGFTAFTWDGTVNAAPEPTIDYDWLAVGIRVL